jgi:hypothetical protein
VKSENCPLSSLFWATWVQLTSPQPNYLTSILAGHYSSSAFSFPKRSLSTSVFRHVVEHSIPHCPHITLQYNPGT